MSRLQSRAIIFLAALLAIAATVVISYSILLPSIEKGLNDQIFPALSRELGYSISAREFRVTLLPPGAKLENLSISSSSGLGPIAEAPAVTISVNLFRLIESLGNDVVAQEIVLEKPQFNIERARNGKWNFESREIPEKSKETPEHKPSSRKVAISHFAIHDGALNIIDHSTTSRQEPLVINQIHLMARNINAPSGTRLEASAALASTHPNLDIKLSSKPAQARGQMDNWNGSFKADALSVESLKSFLPSGLGRPLERGNISAQIALETSADSRIQAKGNLKSREVLFNGKPVDFESNFVVTAPEQEFLKSLPYIGLTGLTIRGPAFDIKGSGFLENNGKRLEFAVQGSFLDLGSLLAKHSPQESQKKPSSPILPPSLIARLRSLTASGQIELERVLVGRFNANKLKARADLKDGVLRILEANSDLYEGHLSAAGSQVDLSKPSPALHLIAQIKSLDLPKAISAAYGSSPLLGTLNGSVNLHGTGTDLAQLRTTMAGTGSASLENGALTSASMEQAFLGPLMKIATATENRSPQGGSGAGAIDTTKIKKAEGSFTLKNGELLFSRPLSIVSSFGQASLSGSLGLDKKIALKGEATLSPEFVERVSGLHVGKEVSAPIEMQGTPSSPKITIDEAKLTKSIIDASPANSIRRKILGNFGK